MTKEKAEIEKNPVVPELTAEAVGLLSDLCFRYNDELEVADLIFVYSTSTHLDELANLVESLLARKVSDQVMLSGGVPGYEHSQDMNIPESQLILEKVNGDKFPGVTFYTETKSRNTKENVEESLKVVDFSGYSRIVFIFKAHAAGRGYLTLRKYCPDARLLQQTYEVGYDENIPTITRANWHTFSFGRSRVWGEFIRIKTYGERGDIAYPDDVRKSVDTIYKIIDQ